MSAPRRTKIVCTLGPATSSPGMIRSLLTAGADAIRLNFSHGTVPDHLTALRLVRRISKDMGREVAVIADLPGPKMRTGRLPGGKPMRLDEGEKVRMSSVPGDDGVVPIDYSGFAESVRRGDRVLLADGAIEIRIDRVVKNRVEGTVIVGGDLGERKGVNLPSRHLPIPAVTENDREILRHVIPASVDFVALSFVQSVEDVLEARKAIRSAGREVPVIAKIEKPGAVDDMERILKEADAVMIARGDLGIEMPAADMPVVQKTIIHAAARLGVPVITATQMLESMIKAPRPTRPETTDIANAIWDGTDAVMLSGETAIGMYPIETVRTMDRIVTTAEAHPAFQHRLPNLSHGDDSAVILNAAASIASSGLYRALVIHTRTGNTAVRLSKLRPAIPVLALTPERGTRRRLSLMWGIRPLPGDPARNADEMIEKGDRTLMRYRAVKRGQRVVLVAGTRLTSGATNLLKIHRVGHSFSGRAKPGH